MNKDVPAPHQNVLDENYVAIKMAALAKTLPKFPDGRIDYSTADFAPVVNIFVIYNGGMLLLRRSDKVRGDKGEWSTVTGYLDGQVPAKQKILQELFEETGIDRPCIKSIMAGKTYESKDQNGKIWPISPFIVELNRKPEITINFEHTEYKWVLQDNLGNAGFTEGMKRCWANCRASELRKDRENGGA